MVIISLFFLYHLFFFMLGLTIERGHAVSSAPARTRFAVIMPSHNEEKVIRSSVQSMLGCRYPGKLLDVYVIADNCSDGTAKEALDAGARVMERFDDFKRGKQYALEWAFKTIDLNQYDAVCVFDADNQVHPDYFQEINALFQQGHRVIQGYVGTKNPDDSWVSANYAYMFWYLCRMQMSRNLLKLSTWLAGTGYCISTVVLKKVGWNVHTLCDDMEYTAQLIIAGERVTFAPDAVFYDEKPVTLTDSLRQRVRWLRGQTQVTLRYVPQLLLMIVTSWWQGNIGAAARAFDGIMWIPMHLVVAYSIVHTLLNSGALNLITILLSVPCLMMLPMLAESIRSLRSWKYLPTAGLFYFTWLPLMFYGVITCGNKKWWRTPHGVLNGEN